MFVTNNNDDYDNFTNNCTNNEKNIDIIIPALFITFPCGLSFLCLMSLITYTKFNHFLKFKKLNMFIQV